MHERVSRHDDEGLYQPKIHSRWIRELYAIGQETGIPITVLLDQALREFVIRYRPPQCTRSEQLSSQDPQEIAAGARDTGSDAHRCSLQRADEKRAEGELPSGDGDHAVCMEKWGAQEEAVTLNRWTFLVKRDSQWKIQEIRYGKEDPLSRGNGGPKRVEIEGG